MAAPARRKESAAEVAPAARRNCTFMNLPKREELSLRSVLALPKASSTTLDCSSRVSRPSASASGTAPSGASPLARTVRKKRMILELSVLPAPDSPEMTIDWLCGASGSTDICRNAASATAYGCGAAPLRLMYSSGLGGSSQRSGFMATSTLAMLV